MEYVEKSVQMPLDELTKQLAGQPSLELVMNYNKSVMGYINSRFVAAGLSLIDELSKPGKGLDVQPVDFQLVMDKFLSTTKNGTLFVFCCCFYLSHCFLFI